VPGATLFLQAVQDIRVGGRQSNAQYQYTLQGRRFEELNEWAPKIAAALQRARTADVNSDQQNKGLESDLVIDRDAAARLGHHRQPDRQHALRRVRPAPGLDHLQRAQPVSRDHGGGAALLAEPGDAEGRLCQHLGRLGQRHAGHQCGGRHTWSRRAGRVGQFGRQRQRRARNLATNSIGATGKGAASTGAAVSTNQETMIPLSRSRSFGQGATPLAVNHQGLLVANTISFNLPPGVSLSDAVAAIDAP
jgi:multidrug efflux pump